MSDTLSQTQPPTNRQVQLRGVALFRSILANFYAQGKKNDTATVAKNLGGRLENGEWTFDNEKNKRDFEKFLRNVENNLIYNPNMIKSSDSAIKNKICDNFEIDEESEEYLSQEIDRVKRIFKLYEKGKNQKEIYEDSLVFEFEIAQFIKIFNRVN